MVRRASRPIDETASLKCPHLNWKPASVEPWPGDTVIGKPALPAFLAERAAVKHTIVAINAGDQRVLDCGPVTAQPVECHRVDRRAVPLDRRGSLHKPSAQQGAWQI